MAQLRPEEDPHFIQSQIDRAIEARATRVVIPPGQYRTVPRDQVHLAIKHAHDLEIEAEGVEMICTETTQAVAIEDCSNLVLRGLTIDYDPLPFTEGRIVWMSPDKQTHEIELFDGYPHDGIVRGWKYEIFDSETNELRFGSYYDPTVEKIGPKKLRVTKAAYFANQPHRPEQVGDIIVIDSDYTPSGLKVHGLVINRGSDVRIEGVTMYTGNCFGFFEEECTGTKYVRCRVDRRSIDDDLVQREYPRVRSLNADAFHSKYAEVGPEYTDCFARFQGDDCIAVNGDYHLVMETHDRTLRVVGKHTMNVCAGDPLEVLSSEGVRMADVQVTGVVPAGTITGQEKQYMRAQTMYPYIKDGDKQVYEIEVSRPVDLRRGSLIASANRMGNGYLIQGCYLGHNRSRGLAVKASNGRIIGNHFVDTRMPAILMNPDSYWLEAGSASNIEISGNSFERCSMKSINICGIGDADGTGSVGTAGIHTDIRICGNKFIDCSEETIYVSATDRISVDDNTFIRCDSPQVKILSSRNVGLGENKLVREDGSAGSIECICD